jgi:hypothetical protein
MLIIHRCARPVLTPILFLAFLLVVLVNLVVNDVEELELVDTTGGGDHAEPVTELLLLEELLGAVGYELEPSVSMIVGEVRVGGIQVLQVAAGEVVVGNDLDLAVTLLGDNDGLAEVVGAALDLDALLEELLEGGDIEDLVVGGLRSVDDVLREGC